MMKNKFGQIVGCSIRDWKGVSFPPNKPIDGNYCRLEPLDSNTHAEELFAANKQDSEAKLWTYLRYGPFNSFDEYLHWIEIMSSKPDPQFYAIIHDEKNKALGVASYLRISQQYGSVEIGHLCFSPLLQGTVEATEAMFLMIQQVFNLGYRRCEWKCDALNTASCNAATRLGFSPEGVFRQDAVVKGRNRDTAWFSIIDTEWPTLKSAFEKWLDPSNFRENGNQIHRLSDLTRFVNKNP